MNGVVSNQSTERFIYVISRALVGTLEREEITFENVDMKELFSFAQEQMLIAPVYGVLKGGMDPELKKYWRASAIQSVTMQVQRTQSFLDTYKELSQKGLQPLVVKGILCRETYPEPDARVSSDEDLYVPRAQYPAFHQAMLELGFSGEAPDYENAHEARYYKGNLMIEGHWELFPQDHSVLNALNTLNNGFWERSTVQEVEGVSLHVLEPTDHMTFLLLHAFKHFINSGVGIRQICDVAQWSKAYEIEWSRVRDAMELANAVYFAAAVFDAGERYFGLIPPADWPHADCELLLEDALHGGIYGTSDMNRKHSGSMTLAAVEDAEKANRVRSLLKTLFPNRSVMAASFQWVNKSALLLPAAWALRIVRYLTSRGKRIKPMESVAIGNERLKLLREYRVIE